MNSSALNGIKVIEIAGLAPAPFCGMILSDFGADVTRVDRVDQKTSDVLSRGKKSICIDLKKEQGKKIFLRLIEKADVLIDPFRPKVLEKLGLGEDLLLKVNPRLIFARLTGFGQKGYYSDRAGHDINYLAVSGMLSVLGRANENPMYPQNFLADFAAGGLLCAFGILVAIQERTKSGKGQVIDSAMVDGTTYLGSFYLKSKDTIFSNNRGENMLDGGAHFYEVYETSDKQYMAVGSIEPQFYALLIKGLGLDINTLPHQLDTSSWPTMKKCFKYIFASKPRSHWESIFDKVDACVTPVINVGELTTHPHCIDRNLVQNVNGNIEPSPAPRLSRTPSRPSFAFTNPGQNTLQILKELGFDQKEINIFFDTGVSKSNSQSNLLNFSFFSKEIKSLFKV
eukprot:TRINITY_DN6973_c0_g1_i1.p1 TRINITY_DN6973_c0_g1~~TRINITY_DN6973_c0_g1_i1.p1  ORF type:complete len:397 (+),score=105.08 TRINITY_DN6973_c0_g1_i1:31-1221(+)